MAEPIEIVAGCRMPSSRSIAANDSAMRKAAEMGSDRLLAALLRYGARHGLPNISAAECAAALEANRPPEPEPRIDNRRSGYRRREADEWTAEQHQAAVKLRRQGLSYGKIGLRVGRSYDAVAARLRDYGGVSSI